MTLIQIFQLILLIVQLGILGFACWMLIRSNREYNELVRRLKNDRHND